MTKTKGTIGILTGGGDVPGLNPAIRALTAGPGWLTWYPTRMPTTATASRN